MKSNTINVSRLRAVIGWLGLLLPWLVILIIGYLPTSISTTYYTNACPVFMIVLGAAAILLFCYHGYDRFDDILNTVAAIAGLGICLFPMWSPNGAWGEWYTVGTFAVIPQDVSNTLHSITAAVFFVCLILDSCFRFTKSAGAKTKKKKIRNVIYIVCGVGMALSFVPMLLQNVFSVIYWKYTTWASEAAGLFFFGVSWLTKADRYPWLAADEADDIISVFIRKLKEKRSVRLASTKKGGKGDNV